MCNRVIIYLSNSHNFVTKPMNFNFQKVHQSVCKDKSFDTKYAHVSAIIMSVRRMTPILYFPKIQEGTQTIRRGGGAVFSIQIVGLCFTVWPQNSWKINLSHSIYEIKMTPYFLLKSKMAVIMENKFTAVSPFMKFQ